MKKLKMIPLLFILLLFSPLLGGCLDANEIETLAIVSGLAIDKGSEKNFHVTAELVGTGSGKENESKPVIVSSEGDTIYDCIKSMKSPDGKRLYLSHCKICVLSTDATPNGIRSLVDWSSRDPESRLTMSLLFSEGRAADLFSAPPKSGNTVAFNIADSLKQDKTGLSNISIHNFIDFNVDLGKTPFLPVISLSEDGAPKIEKLAFFKNDLLQATITGDEVMAFSLLRGDKKNQLLTITNDRGSYTVRLTPKKASSNYSFDQQLSFQLSYQLSAELFDISYPFDPYDEDEKARMEVEIECAVKERLSALIRRSQNDIDLDVASLGATIYRSNPALYAQIKNNYSEFYRTAEFHFETLVTLQGTGVSSTTVFGNGRGGVK